jgi:class 3 adenylate cyclase
VNMGARLCGLCTGTDLVLSEAVLRDQEVSAWLATAGRPVQVAKESVRLKGFGEETFTISRVRQTAPISRPPF